jgi:hypothetical protein
VETNNLDLATFFVMREVYPLSITVQTRGFRMFNFPDTPARRAASEFWAGFQVPARAFLFTRTRLKKAPIDELIGMGAALPPTEATGEAPAAASPLAGPGTAP